MGARAAVHLSAADDVSGVVALAPWWPRSDADLVPTRCRLLTLHGSSDSWSSEALLRWARERGVDARWGRHTERRAQAAARLASLERADNRIRHRTSRWTGAAERCLASRRTGKTVTSRTLAGDRHSKRRD